MKPNISNILKWIDALESGEFAQTKGTLTDSDGHCCLGVACQVAMRNGVELMTSLEAPGEDTVLYEGFWSASLPDKVTEWLGIEEEDPLIGNYTLSEWNDNQGLTFEEIAAKIRVYYDAEISAAYNARQEDAPSRINVEDTGYRGGGLMGRQEAKP